MEGGTERAIADRNPKHDSGSPNAASSSLEKLPFDLQEGEKIIRELKPRFFGFILTRALGGYVGVLCLVIVSIAVLIILRGSLSGFLIVIFLFPPFILLLILIISLKPLIQYGKSWYWITNHRVIGKRGFLGYTVDSIPLENVTDVVLTRTLLDRLLGLSSLIIMPMGGSLREEGMTTEDMAKSPNFFPALTQETARELQRVLFNLRDDLKRVKQVSSAVTTPGVSQPTTTPPPLQPTTAPATSPKQKTAPTTPSQPKTGAAPANPQQKTGAAPASPQPRRSLTRETAMELQKVLFNLREGLKKPKRVSSTVTAPGVSQQKTAPTTPSQPTTAPAAAPQSTTTPPAPPKQKIAPATSPKQKTAPTTPSQPKTGAAPANPQPRRTHRRREEDNNENT